MLDDLTGSILAPNPSGLVKFLNELKLQSIEPKRFLEQYLYYLRERAFSELASPNLPRLVRIFDACSLAYPKMKEFPNGFLLLEMTFLGQMQPGLELNS